MRAHRDRRPAPSATDVDLRSFARGPLSFLRFQSSFSSSFGSAISQRFLARTRVTLRDRGLPTVGLSTRQFETPFPTNRGVRSAHGPLLPAPASFCENRRARESLGPLGVHRFSRMAILRGRFPRGGAAQLEPGVFVEHGLFSRVLSRKRVGTSRLEARKKETTRRAERERERQRGTEVEGRDK